MVLDGSDFRFIDHSGIFLFYVFNFQERMIIISVYIAPGRADSTRSIAIMIRVKLSQVKSLNLI